MRPAAKSVLPALVEDMDKKLALMPPGGDRMMLWGLRTTLGILAREADDAAAIRLEEIGALARLLHDGAAACPSELRARLLAAVDSADSARNDIRISALERQLDGLRSALIELQAWAETAPGPQAATLLARSWHFLVHANRRRAISAKPW